MRNALFTTLWLLYCFSVHAQGNFSISTEYGIGRSFERGALSDIPLSRTNPSVTTHSYFSSAQCYRMAAIVSYNIGNWSEQIGIEYSRDGYTRTWDLYYVDVSTGKLNQIFPSPNGAVYYYHLSAPIDLGYNFHIGSKTVIAAYVGLLINNNVDYSINLSSGTKQYLQYITQYIDFSTGYNSYNSDMNLSFLAFGKLEIKYAVSPRLYALLSPRFDWMLSSMVKDPLYTIEDSRFKLYNYSVSAGLGWRFNRPGRHTASSSK